MKTMTFLAFYWRNVYYKCPSFKNKSTKTIRGMLILMFGHIPKRVDSYTMIVYRNVHAMDKKEKRGPGKLCDMLSVLKVVVESCRGRNARKLKEE